MNRQCELSIAPGYMFGASSLGYSKNHVVILCDRGWSHLFEVSGLRFDSLFEGSTTRYQCLQHKAESNAAGLLVLATQSGLLPDIE